MTQSLLGEDRHFVPRIRDKSYINLRIKLVASASNKPSPFPLGEGRGEAVGPGRGF